MIRDVITNQDRTVNGFPESTIRIGANITQPIETKLEKTEHLEVVARSVEARSGRLVNRGPAIREIEHSDHVKPEIIASRAKLVNQGSSTRGGRSKRSYRQWHLSN